MEQCSIYNTSLRFSRAVYGGLTLAAFLFKNQWLVLATSVLMAFGVISLKLNIAYQFHALIVRKLFNEKTELTQKELGELNFVAGMTSILLLIGFILLYSGKYQNFAWIYILVIAFLIFLACFVGFCVATLMYVFFKRAFKKQ